MIKLNNNEIASIAGGDQSKPNFDICDLNQADREKLSSAMGKDFVTKLTILCVNKEMLWTGLANCEDASRRPRRRAISHANELLIA